jgi:hypothetical protein
MNWLKLTNFHLRPPTANTFARKPNDQLKYDQHRYTLKQNQVPIEEYINKKYLKSRFKWAITDNNFPYDVEPGVKHKILWISNLASLDSGKIHNIIDRYAKNNQSDYVYFENKNNSKSIPEVRHFHLFLHSGKK